MRTITITSAMLCTTLAIPAARAVSQSAPLKTLGAPHAKFAEPFTHVSGVREQSDGRVVVLDDYDRRIFHLDFRARTAIPLGRSGQGPGEYTLPLRLVALAGDTTLAVDMSGGGRAVVITPNGVSGTPLRSVGNETGKPLFMRSELQSDARGRIYELVSRISMEGDRRMQSVSDGVRRLDRSTGRADTIGMVSRRLVSSLVKPKSTDSKFEAPESGAMRAGGPPPPYSSGAAWAVAPDGRIAVISPNPYRVTFYEPDGKVVEAPAISYSPVPLTSALKEEWRIRARRPVLTITYTASGTAGGTSKPRFTEPEEWPDALPPFILNATVRYAPDGMLWLERTATAGSPQTFDVIDRAGKVASRVAMPRGTRLEGFGQRTIYAVRVDDDDLEYLQRYAVP